MGGSHSPAVSTVPGCDCPSSPHCLRPPTVRGGGLPASTSRRKMAARGGASFPEATWLERAGKGCSQCCLILHASSAGEDRPRPAVQRPPHGGGGGGGRK